MLKKLATLVVFLTVFAIAGCNSGSGSSASATSSPPSSTPPSSGGGTPSSSPPSSTPPSPGATYKLCGSIFGAEQAGVVITTTPGGASATADTSGAYCVTGLPDGTYTVAPSFGSTVFTPASQTVTVNGADVTGVNFTDPVPLLTSGKVMYPCPQAICVKDLASGTEGVAITDPTTGWQPVWLQAMRDGPNVVYNGSNMGGLNFSPLATYNPTRVLPGTYLTTDCEAGTNAEFDTANTTAVGDIVVFAAPCSVPGSGTKQDIFIVQMNGSMKFIRVTNDPDNDRAPVFGGVNNSNNLVAVVWVNKTTGNLVERVVNITPGAPGSPLVGIPKVLAKGVVTDDMRPLSVNLSYTKIAFVKKVNGEDHIMVLSMAGTSAGSITDLGPGNNPSWDLGGSNLLLYSLGSKVYAVHADGTGRVEIPVPSNYSPPPFGPPPAGGGGKNEMAEIMFTPPGY